MKKKNEGILQEFFDSVKYMFESKKGKYSLETYLEIMGEYADRLILECKKERYIFMGGNCKVSSKEECPDKFLFRVEIFFEDSEGQNMKKEAERFLDCEKFTSETIAKIKEAEELIFEISEPSGGN